MAFTATQINAVPLSADGLHMAWGTFANTGGDTGGTVTTKLANVIRARLQHTGAAVVADKPAVVSYSAGTFIIKTTADTAGVWVAEGRM